MAVFPLIEESIAMKTRGGVFVTSRLLAATNPISINPRPTQYLLINKTMLSAEPKLAEAKRFYVLTAGTAGSGSCRVAWRLNQGGKGSRAVCSNLDE